MSEPLFLLVDDERTFREFLAEALEAEGFRVLHAGTAAAALREARRVLPRVILLDQNLPDGSGLDLLPALAQLPVRPVVIVITAHAQVGLAVDAVKSGAFHYLSKPFAFGDLMDVLASAAITATADADDDVPAPGALVGESPAMQELRRQVQRVGRSPVAAVLLQGESGTGKELIAHAIHEASAGRPGPFVAVNCAALTETLLLSELFGHERGAFTDARQQKKGVFERAHGGTLLLDEVSEMGPRSQAAFLRALEQRCITRVGGHQELPVDVRVIAATNVELGQQVAAGQFRGDLYHRLNVVRLELPPLRARGDDVLHIAQALSSEIAHRYAESPRPFTPAARRLLATYAWPGNVRELRNVVERAYVIGSGPAIDAADLPAEVRGDGGPPGAGPTTPSPSTMGAMLSQTASFQGAKRDVVERFERAFLLDALARAEGNVTVAAERAGVLRQVFQRLLLRHGITPADYRDGGGRVRPRE
jgi:DNA-binding NtrC family response regulator